MADVNFGDAARRHWSDAQQLQRSGSDANAGQLLGLSAECGLKALYRCFFLPPKVNGDIDWDTLSDADRKKYRAHINMLCLSASVLASSPMSAKYLSFIPSIGNFTSWHTDQRYWSNSEQSKTCSPVVPAWDLAAREVMAMLEEAVKDGIV